MLIWQVLTSPAPGFYSVAIPSVRSTQWSAASSSNPPLPLSDSVAKGLHSCSTCDISIQLLQWMVVSGTPQPASSPRSSCGTALHAVLPARLSSRVLPASSAHMTLQGLLCYPWARAVNPPNKICIWAWAFFGGCSISAPGALADSYTAIPTFFRFFPIFATNGFHSIPLWEIIL